MLEDLEILGRQFGTEDVLAGVAKGSGAPEGVLGFVHGEEALQGRSPRGGGIKWEDDTSVEGFEIAPWSTVGDEDGHSGAERFSDGVSEIFGAAGESVKVVLGQGGGNSVAGNGPAILDGDAGVQVGRLLL